MRLKNNDTINAGISGNRIPWLLPAKYTTENSLPTCFEIRRTTKMPWR
jgi:hypothetical protein